MLAPIDSIALLMLSTAGLLPSIFYRGFVSIFIAAILLAAPLAAERLLSLSLSRATPIYLCLPSRAISDFLSTFRFDILVLSMMRTWPCRRLRLTQRALFPKHFSFSASRLMLLSKISWRFSPHEDIYIALSFRFISPLHILLLIVIAL